MHDLKQQIRQRTLAARDALTDRGPRSLLVLEHALQLPEFGAAGTVLIYVSARSEVRTRETIAELLADRKSIVVPWCRDDEHLDLFHLHSLQDLVPGRFGILEPRADLRADPHRVIAPTRLDLLLLPGAAFDRRGGRIGYGRGYFDRLLAQTRPDALKAGLAFDCQLVDEVPMGPHDVRLDVVVTEVGVYRVPN